MTRGRLFNFVSGSITDQSDTLDRFNEAAVTLRALGLLTKAVEPIQTSLEIILAQRD